MTKSNIPFWDSARHPSAQHHSWPATGHQNSDETCKAILLHEGQLIQRKQIRWPSLFFFLRKTTTTATLDKTEKDLLGPLLVRVFDLTNHLFICTTLCRLKNYFLSYYVFHIYRIGELAGRAPALHAGGIGIDTQILHLVPLFFCLFFGKSLPCKVLTKHLFC